MHSQVPEVFGVLRAGITAINRAEIERLDKEAVEELRDTEKKIDRLFTPKNLFFKTEFIVDHVPNVLLVPY
ncbi:MAG: hypothetical protein LBJ67_12565 [Planctomycetaceae bacterium]|jgi:hypothetical protein|nr:hypothetical protein [Planctomycetaceae bacterium]